MRKTRIFVVAIFATVVAILGGRAALGATPASAVNYDITMLTPGGGSLHGWGYIDFTAHDKFDWKINVRDLCPADAYGGVVYLQIYDMDGGFPADQLHRAEIGVCDDPADTYTGSIDEPWNIQAVNVWLCQTHLGSTACIPDPNDERWIDNPHTS